MNDKTDTVTVIIYEEFTHKLLAVGSVPINKLPITGGSLLMTIGDYLTTELSIKQIELADKRTELGQDVYTVEVSSLASAANLHNYFT